MAIWHQLIVGIRSLVSPSSRNRDLADEVQQYLEEATAALVASGLSPEEAKRTARRQMGSTAVVQEQLRSFGWENSIRSFAADLRYALRQLRCNAGFTAVGAITLALGIGACTAIFSAVNPILFEPLPYPHANRILMIWGSYQGARSETAFGTYRELIQRSHSFETIAVFEPWQPAMTGGIQPERLNGQNVSASYFKVVGIAPLLGRDFQPSDDVDHGPKVVILSDNLWRRHFNSDPAVLGHSIKLDGDNYTVIGVMPQTFENVLSPSAEIWTPSQYSFQEIATNFDSWVWGNHLHIAGRLKPGIGRDEAVREIDAIAHTPLRDFPRPRWASLQHGLIVDSLQDDIAHDIKSALLAVFGAVILLLTIACVNVINLMLARNAQRRGEFSIRAALGEIGRAHV